MPAVYFKPGDFVEYKSTADCTKTLRGIVTHVGWIGAEPKQPRQVAFVSHIAGRSPLMVGIERLHPATGFAMWLDGRSGVA